MGAANTSVQVVPSKTYEAHEIDQSCITDSKRGLNSFHRLRGSERLGAFGIYSAAECSIETTCDGLS